MHDGARFRGHFGQRQCSIDLADHDHARVHSDLARNSAGRLLISADLTARQDAAKTKRSHLQPTLVARWRE